MDREFLIHILRSAREQYARRNTGFVNSAMDTILSHLPENTRGRWSIIQSVYTHLHPQDKRTSEDVADGILSVLRERVTK